MGEGISPIGDEVEAQLGRLQKPPEQLPSREMLSYSEQNVELTRTPIDWELVDEEAFDAMSPADRLAAERHRRLYYALQDLARTLDRVVPPEEGMTVSERINRELNPDQYPLTLEDPQVGPSER